jgi:hypothetical protein
MSFADIGGIGLNSLNERISIALQSGASEATMIDYRRPDFPEWDVFKAKMKELELDQYRVIASANLEARDFPAQVGKYDFVHCMGILYHAPAPMIMLDNLSRISNRYMIVNTVTIADRIENEAGSLSFEGSQVLFLPGLSERERAILDLHYQDLVGWPPDRFNAYAPRIDDEEATMPWLQTRAASEKHFWGGKGDLSYSPYWWLFTRQAFRAAVCLFGFTIKAETSFREHTLTLFCERDPGADGQNPKTETPPEQ